MKKIFTLILTLIVIATCLVSCAEADRVNYNISQQARYFECERRITVYNARTDTVIFVAEGNGERKILLVKIAFFDF